MATAAESLEQTKRARSSQYNGENHPGNVNLAISRPAVRGGAGRGDGSMPHRDHPGGKEVRGSTLYYHYFASEHNVESFFVISL